MTKEEYNIDKMTDVFLNSDIVTMTNNDMNECQIVFADEKDARLVFEAIKRAKGVYME